MRKSPYDLLMAKSPIDAAVAKFPAPQRAALLAVRDSLVTLLPSATQEIAWGMPTIKVEGIGVASFFGFKAHNSLFPYDTDIVAFAETKGYEVTKGGIHFDIDKPMPTTMLKQIVKLRIESINASFPKKSGESKEFFPNGQLKASGKIKSGELHGTWEWFRKDGTLLRTETYTNGSRVS
jgi:uncharacterized protein YdhG (YjbR/CyaY superfamily)